MALQIHRMEYKVRTQSLMTKLPSVVVMVLRVMTAERPVVLEVPAAAAVMMEVELTVEAEQLAKGMMAVQLAETR